MPVDAGKARTTMVQSLMFPAGGQLPWRERLADANQRKQVDFALVYVKEFGHRTPGASDFQLIATLAGLLDIEADERGKLVRVLEQYANLPGDAGRPAREALGLPEPF